MTYHQKTPEENFFGFEKDSKQLLRQQMQRDVEAFLQQGGKIKICDLGTSAYTYTAAKSDLEIFNDKQEESAQEDQLFNL